MQMRKIENNIKRDKIAGAIYGFALGNGSLMRAMPMALVDKPFLNEAQGRMTHNNFGCSQVIQECHQMIQNYLNGNLYTYQVKGLLEPSGYIKWIEQFDSDVKDFLKSL